jgi:hypothetical protein
MGRTARAETLRPPFTGRIPVFAGNTARAQAVPAYRRGMETRVERHPKPGKGQVVAGIILMIVGLSLLVDRLDLDVRLSGHFWPFILIVMGVARLTDGGAACDGQRHTRSGAWLLYLGLWGLVTEFHLFGLDYRTSWPLLVIGAGAGIVWRALDTPRPHPDRQEQ